jgi:hypothetical protein
VAALADADARIEQDVAQFKRAIESGRLAASRAARIGRGAGAARAGIGTARSAVQ